MVRVGKLHLLKSCSNYWFLLKTRFSRIPNDYFLVGMRKAAKLEKSEEEAYIHFLEELSTEELNIKQTASYLKGEHCNQLFELRFHPAMRASNHQTPEST